MLMPACARAHGELLALCLIARWSGTELMKGVVKRWPRNRSCAGWNLWCYLFCGLIAAFSPSNFRCRFYFDFGVMGCCLVLVGFILFCFGFCLFCWWLLLFFLKENNSRFCFLEYWPLWNEPFPGYGRFLNRQFGSRSDLAQSRTVSKSGLRPNGSKLCLWTCHSLRCSVHFELLALFKCWAEVIGPHVVRN